jgi:hypothetical protein
LLDSDMHFIICHIHQGVCMCLWACTISHVYVVFLPIICFIIFIVINNVSLIVQALRLSDLAGVSLRFKKNCRGWRIIQDILMEWSLAVLFLLKISMNI